MSVWTSTRTAPALGALGVAVTVGFLVAIAWSHYRPMAPVYADYGPGPLVIRVGLDAPCSVQRVELACERWADAGWPRCEVGGGADVVDLVELEGADVQPAHRALTRSVLGQRSIHIAADDCDTWALEHEIGHAVHGLDDVTRSGQVMSGYVGATRIPAIDVPNVKVGGQGTAFPRSP